MQAPRVGLNWHPGVVAHDVLSLAYLQSVPHVLEKEFHWHRSANAAHPVEVVKFTHAVWHEPVTGFTWHREPAARQLSAFVPKASEHDCVQLPAIHWQALIEPQAVVCRFAHSVLQV